MKLHASLLSLLVVYALAAPIDLPEEYQELNKASETNGQNPGLAQPNAGDISESLVAFQDELSSVFLYDLPDKGGYQEDHDAIIIPRTQLTERVMNAIGFRDLVKYSKRFKLQNRAFESKLEILVPEMTIPYFVFNTSDSLNIPQSLTRDGYSKFLDRSAPFELPAYSTLVDYFLVLPIPERFNPRSLIKGVLTVNRAKLPLFKQPEGSNSPLLAFVFKSGNSVVESKELEIPLLGVKNYMGVKDLNMFFDIFAKTWIEDVSMTQLVHGVFCTLSRAHLKESFCIKIKEDFKNLSLFPAFNRDTISPTLTKMDRLSSKGASIGTTSDQDLVLSELTLPLSILKTNGSDSVETFSPRGKGYTQVISKLKSNLRLTGTNLVKRSAQGEDFESQNIDHIRDVLNNRLREKKLKDRLIKGDKNKKAHIVSKFGKSEEEPERSQKKMRTRITTPKSKPVLLESFKDQNMAQVEEYKKNKVKDTIENIKVTSKRVNNRLSNNDEAGNLDTQVQEATSNDCEPITWFNVFHHSVFGKTKFCGL